MRPRLGVNVDHVATIRQARKTLYPDPVEAALVAERAGADQITAHLREDRRHIQDRDLLVLRKVVKTQLNLEKAAVKPVIRLLREAGIRVSLFIDPDLDQVRASHKLEAHAIELHTGRYAE